MEFSVWFYFCMKLRILCVIFSVWLLCYILWITTCRNLGKQVVLSLKARCELLLFVVVFCHKCSWRGNIDSQTFSGIMSRKFWWLFMVSLWCSNDMKWKQTVNFFVMGIHTSNLSNYENTNACLWCNVCVRYKVFEHKGGERPRIEMHTQGLSPFDQLCQKNSGNF